MTRTKPRKRQKFAYRIFACRQAKISCHHTSDDDYIVMVHSLQEYSILFHLCSTILVLIF